MVTALTIIGGVIFFCAIPAAMILGLLGFWLFGFWGALIGFLSGYFIQGAWRCLK